MQKFIGGALALIILASCGKQDAGKPETAYDFSKDAYIWLEDVEGEEALAWVEEQNAVSLGHLEALPVFAPLKERNLEIYNSDERIATPATRTTSAAAGGACCSTTTSRGARNGSSCSISICWPKVKTKTGSGKARNACGRNTAAAS
jgi:hypothetical protein